MKVIKSLALLTLFFSVLLFQSCESEPCENVTCLNDGICLDGTCDCPTGYSDSECGTHCSENILGTWNVTNTTNQCDFSEFQFFRRSGTSGIDIVLIGDGNVWTGYGTLSDDCRTLPYTSSLNGTDRNGTFIFDGNNLTENHGTSCTYDATKL